jgi:hypothetical protein
MSGKASRGLGATLDSTLINQMPDKRKRNIWCLDSTIVLYSHTGDWILIK